MKVPFLSRREKRDEFYSGLENPSVDLTTALIANTDGVASSSMSLTPVKALRLTAVYAAVRVIAESIASLPVVIGEDEDSGDGGREIVSGDDRLELLDAFPNEEMTAMELIETWLAHAMLWGHGYLYIVRGPDGMPQELWPLDPSKTSTIRAKQSGRLVYVTQLPSGGSQKLDPADVIDLKSILGFSPIRVAREALGAAVAAEEYAGRFWANNARPGGLIELPDTMEEDEMDEFMVRWRAGHEGLKRSQITGILSGGATWKDVGIAPGLAQFIETRQFGVREVARLFRIPPHMIGDLEGTVTRASIEQQSIEFVTYTLRPWIVRAEQAMRLKLFNRKDDIATRRFAEFQVDALMRGDVKSRYDAYAVGIQWGFLSRGDARRFEQRAGVQLVTKPADNLDEFLVPLNMLPASKLDQVQPAGAGAVGGVSGQTNSLSWLSLMLRHDADLADGLAKLANEAAEKRRVIIDQNPELEDVIGSEAPLQLPAGDPPSE